MDHCSNLTLDFAGIALMIKESDGYSGIYSSACIGLMIKESGIYSSGAYTVQPSLTQGKYTVSMSKRIHFFYQSYQNAIVSTSTENYGLLVESQASFRWCRVQEDISRMRLQVHCLCLCLLVLVALTGLSQARFFMDIDKLLAAKAQKEYHHVQHHRINVRSPQLKPVGDLVKDVLTDTGKAVGDLVGGKDKETTTASN